MSKLHPSTSIKTSKAKILLLECRICGAPAEYSHFGVISCPSCKIFFRRNGKARPVSLIILFLSNFHIGSFREN